MTEDIIGYERWLQSEPDSAPLHDDVAELYLEPEPAAGRCAALQGRGASRPRVGGRAFQPGHRIHDRRRLRLGACSSISARSTLKPDYAQAHNNLGSILLRYGQGRRGDPAPHSRRSGSIRPMRRRTTTPGSRRCGGRSRPRPSVILKRAVQLAPDSPGGTRRSGLAAGGEPAGLRCAIRGRPPAWLSGR